MWNNIYEQIIDLYKHSVDEWREYLYNNIHGLMRKNPLLWHNNYTYTRDDIISESFLLADEIILNNNVSYNKKVSRLWYLFNRWWWALYNKINHYWFELYNMDDIMNSDNISYYIDVDILQYILIKNNIITPLEAKVLKYLWEWRWKYEIARIMKTTYYNIKDIVETIWIKIKNFLAETEKDAENNNS